MQHRDHRDQVGLALAGGRGELLEPAPPDAHPRIARQARARRGGHALIGIDPGDARETGGQLPGEHAGPAADVDSRLPAGRLRRIQPWKCSL